MKRDEKGYDLVSNANPTITWLGHAAFQIATADGRTILVDPWITNPSSPDAKREFDRVDIMLITHGHFDHVGDAVDLGSQFQPSTVANFEIATWLGQKGLTDTRPMNTGGTQAIDDVEITLVPAIHSSGISDDESIVYGGEPGGFIINIDGFKIYHAGDTTVSMDMTLIGDLYQPDIACLPIGGHFTMGPREAAKACELLHVKKVIPMHYGNLPRSNRYSSGTSRENWTPRFWK